MNISAIACAAKKLAYKGLIKARKHSPEILIALGGASIIGGTVSACFGTLKVKEICEERKELLSEIDDAEKKAPKLKDGNTYTTEDAKRDKRIVKWQTIYKIAKIYAPAAVCIILGFTCIGKSHLIMKHRFSVMCTAYATLKESYDSLYRTFNQYRNEVISHNPELDNEIKKNFPDEDKFYNSDRYVSGSRAYLFDETSPMWSKSAWRNKCVLETITNDLQRLLRNRGWVTINDVNKAFGLPETAEGQYLGWTDKIPESDEYGVISLGPEVERFIKEVENGAWNNTSATGILLHPNIHGNILEFI